MTPKQEAAMRQALEALERSRHWSPLYRESTGVISAIEALKEALSEPVQEPVAWMLNEIEDNIITHRPADIDRHPERWAALYKEPLPCPTCESLARTVMLDQTSHDSQGAAELRRLHQVEKERNAMFGIFEEHCKYAEWSETVVYGLDGSIDQHCVLEMFLPVPLHETDKSPETALKRFIDNAIAKLEGRT